MKAISFVEAKDIIGGALNPFAGLVKGAQLGYDTGASIMGMEAEMPVVVATPLSQTIRRSAMCSIVGLRSSSSAL